MFFFGGILAVLMGMSLGLLGGGGSILTVPILTYILNFEAKTSIALSLGIVGLTSLVGSFRHWRHKNVDIRVGLFFAFFASFGTYLGARGSTYISSSLQMLMFSLVVLTASFFMFRDSFRPPAPTQDKLTLQKISPKFILKALSIGFLTGVIGVGGGFLIVPSLVLGGKLEMRKAIGTSLLVITLNSLVGFMGHLKHTQIPWIFFWQFGLFSVAGIYIGSSLVRYVSPQKLKKAFAVFLVFVGLLVLYKNRGVLF